MKHARVLLILLLVGVVSVACKKTETVSETSDTAATSTVSDTSATTATTASMASTPLNDQDKDFLQSAARSGKAEVEMAQDGLAHATNADVKAFAQRMVDDHSKANQEAATFASSRGVDLPDMTDAKMKEAKERMMKLTGKSFDQAFVKQMVADHKDAVQKFTDASTKVADADLKSWVQKTLPTLQDHLKTAQDLQTKLGGK